MAVLLVLRRAGDARIARFLADPDPLLVVEAARAIYDGPIDGAMPALAGLAAGLSPAAEDDRQIGEALHRRVIGANVRLRSEGGAAALARYAADERQREDLRSLALEELGRYATPAARDLTMGFVRPLSPVDRAVVAPALYAEGRALVESSFGARALEIAGEYGVSLLSDEELAARGESEETAPRERIAALVALRARAEALGGAQASPLRAVAEAAIASEEASVRVAGRDLLTALDPEAGLAQLLGTVESAPDEAERREAWRRLGPLNDERAREAIARGIERWKRGALEDGLALDVLEAARVQADPVLAEAGRALLAGDPAAPVASRRWARAGGDPEAGRAVFQTVGDCQRCHGDPEAEPGAAGHAATRIGPALAGVAGKGADHVLESVLVPDAKIAKGFDPPSAMPPVGLALEPRALRDVVAYVMTLD